MVTKKPDIDHCSYDQTDKTNIPQYRVRAKAFCQRSAKVMRSHLPLFCCAPAGIKQWKEVFCQFSRSMRYDGKNMHTDTPVESIWIRQFLPLALTVVSCSALIGLIYLEIRVLNQFTTDDISLVVNPLDVLIGLTIYLKTSIDFAVFIGRLMHRNPGTKNRIAIELGTALGNAAGTMVILLIWTFFKEVRWLLVIMILLAALVLFKLAEDGLEHTHDAPGYPKFFFTIVRRFEHVLHAINRVTHPLLRIILPETGMQASGIARFWPLFFFAFSIPFVLGLDDFAGYVPLFSIVNVFGFAIGVFLGHMLLNILLYISPERTIKLVKMPVLSLLGSIAFVSLAVWGLYEVIHLIGS